MPRFPFAVLCALALHGLASLLRAPRTPDLPPSLTKTQPAGQTIELEELALEDAFVEQPSGGPTLAHEPEANPAPARRIASAPSQATRAPLEAPPPTSPAGDGLAVADPSPAGEAEPARKIDLGLDGHFFLHDRAPAPEPGPAPAAELGPRARKSTVQNQLSAALSAADVQRGLARGNALVGSLHSAVRAEGPLRGDALFRVTMGSDGSFGNVELLAGAAPEWAAALGAFRKLAASKRVRIPPGAKGLRVTFSIKAKVQRPSGKDVSESSVYVAPPSPLPIGIGTHGDFDLADLAGGEQRLVYARVVAEEVL